MFGTQVQILTGLSWYGFPQVQWVDVGWWGSLLLDLHADVIAKYRRDLGEVVRLGLAEKIRSLLIG
jgi:hypothetical protein